MKLGGMAMAIQSMPQVLAQAIADNEKIRKSPKWEIFFYDFIEKV